MVEIETLKHFLHPRQLGQTTISNGPVGQHFGQGREDFQSATACCIGIEEGGYHDFGSVRTDCAVGGVEWFTGIKGSFGIDGSGIPRLYLLAVAFKGVNELGEGLGLVTFVRRTCSFKCRTNGNGGHGE